MTRRLLAVICASVLVGCAGTAEEADPGTTVAPPVEEDPVATTEATDEPAAEGGEGEAVESEEGSSGGGGDSPELMPAGDSEVAVNGEPIGANSLLRCSGDLDLDLQVLGDGYILFITVSSTFGQELSIQGEAVGDNGSTGVFDTSVMQTGDQWFSDEGVVDGPILEWEGDRVTGTATLSDTFETADPIEVTFDVQVPEEVHDCSL